MRREERPKAVEQRLCIREGDVTCDPRSFVLDLDVLAARVKCAAFQPLFLFTHPPLPFSLLLSPLPWFCTGFATRVVVYPTSYRSNYWVITRVAMVKNPTHPLQLALDTLHEAGSVARAEQCPRHCCPNMLAPLSPHFYLVTYLV